MFCPTPPIVLSDVLGSQRRRRDVPSDSSIESILKPRRKRQTAGTVNEERNIDVELGFLLDGVPNYINLTENLPEFSRLDVFTNPDFPGFDPPSFSQTFTSTWPIEDKYLEIKVSQSNIIIVTYIQFTQTSAHFEENVICSIQNTLS